MDDLKTFVLDACKDQIIHKKIAKKDIEAFLSAFVYNTYGATNIDSIAKMVFTNENYVANKLSHKVRANPPPDVVNSDMLRSLSPDEEDTNGQENATAKSGFSSQPVDYKKAAGVLKEIEDKVYCGGLPRRGTFQSVFRSIFDCDGDGFVSHADFEAACRKLQVKAQYSDVVHAIRALDTEQKGFLDFRSFAKKLTPGISERMTQLCQTPTNVDDLLHLPDVGPGKKIISEHIKKAQTVGQTVRDVR